VISLQLNKKHAAVYSWAIRKQSWGWDQATHRLSWSGARQSVSPSCIAVAKAV